MLLSTHDIDEALQLACRILLLGGRPARFARTWTITREHAHEPSHKRELDETRGAILRALSEAHVGNDRELSLKESQHV